MRLTVPFHVPKNGTVRGDGLVAGGSGVGRGGNANTGDAEFELQLTSVTTAKVMRAMRKGVIVIALASLNRSLVLPDVQIG
jgi:hypothetical protein